MNEIGEVKRVTSSGSLRVEVPRFLCKHDIVLRTRVLGAILYKFQKGYFVKLGQYVQIDGLGPYQSLPWERFSPTPFAQGRL